MGFGAQLSKLGNSSVIAPVQNGEYLTCVSSTLKDRSFSGEPAEIYKAGGPPVAEKLTVISRYVEKTSHPSRIQGCNNYPPIQKERGSLSL